MKNFNKVLSLILAVVLACGAVATVSAYTAFTDLTSSHWGHSYVQRLVGDGTINGYQDGSFRPEANVTRAEFVKMIGKTEKLFDVAFDDIAGHWAYDYIMYSDMDVVGTAFYPDVAITRNDVVNLLWKRAGSPKAYAPSVITNQSTNANAAAWAYSYGIMNGDDGVTLRLGDGVTRAEAAALICRSRDIDTTSEKKSFVKTVKPEILEKVYNSLNVFDEKYDPSKTYTNGEIAGIAMRLAFDEKIPSFTKLNTDFSVNRPNSFAFYTACHYVWGKDRMTEEFYDATANNIDTIALLGFAADFKSSRYNPKSNGSVYADVPDAISEDMKRALSVTYVSGIRLDNSDNIYPQNAMTGENIALILLQLDTLAGFQSVYNIASMNVTREDAPIRTDVAKYPSSMDKYPVILEAIPNEVYSSDFVDSKGVVRTESTADCYDFTRSRYEVFTNFLAVVESAIMTLGADVDFVFVPSMVIETESEHIMKVKVTVNSFEAGKSFDDIFPNVIQGAKPELTNGMTFYADIASGIKLGSVNIVIDNTVLSNIY